MILDLYLSGLWNLSNKSFREYILFEFVYFALPKYLLRCCFFEISKLIQSKFDFIWKFTKVKVWDSFEGKVSKIYIISVKNIFELVFTMNYLRTMASLLSLLAYLACLLVRLHACLLYFLTCSYVLNHSHKKRNSLETA